MKRRRKGKINFGANFKKATAQPAINESLWALLALPLWIVPSSVLKLTGWSGWAMSFATTWLAGALFDKPAIRYAAVGLGITQIGYTKMSGALNDIGIPPWRMGGGADYNGQKIEAKKDESGGAAGLFGMQGYPSPIALPVQEGARVINTPQGPIMSRPAPELTTAPAPSDTMMGMSGYNADDGGQLNDNVSLMPGRFQRPTLHDAYSKVG